MADEITIVGSGAAGVAAALRLVQRGMRPTIIDVGVDPPTGPRLSGNFYQLQQQADLFEVMIGADYERARARSRFASPLPAKLTAPRIGFVTRETDRLQPVIGRNFSVVRSFATGGLANAWGAGLYRATDADLVGFPIQASELTPYYDLLTAEIGISGDRDDLEQFFGPADGLLPPLRLSRKAAWLLARYQQRRSRWHAAGFFLGRPRLAVLSEAFAGRSACDYSNLEFWEPNLPFIYTPRWTLNRLIDADLLIYRKGLLVESWSEAGRQIVVRARDLVNGSTVSFTTRYLILAAGAIGSARLALASNTDHRTKLSLLDNSAVQFPLILPRFIGRALETTCFGLTQLNLVYSGREYETPLQASILEITSPARAEFFASLPLAARDNLRMIRHLVPAMLVLQLFFPAKSEQAAGMSLSENGTLTIAAPPQTIDLTIIQQVVKVLRWLGALTHASLITVPPPGQQGIHYAATLPMTEHGKDHYTCDRFGRLHGQSRVYAVDGSVFPRLPAKNCSMLMMANAMRVSDRLADIVKDEAWQRS